MWVASVQAQASACTYLPTPYQIQSERLPVTCIWIEQVSSASDIALAGDPKLWHRIARRIRGLHLARGVWGLCGSFTSWYDALSH